jgi:hypothetical protein
MRRTVLQRQHRLHRQCPRMWTVEHGLLPAGRTTRVRLEDHHERHVQVYRASSAPMHVEWRRTRSSNLRSELDDSGRLGRLPNLPELHLALDGTAPMRDVRSISEHASSFSNWQSGGSRTPVDPPAGRCVLPRAHTLAMSSDRVTPVHRTREAKWHFACGAAQLKDASSSSLEDSNDLTKLTG